MNNIDSYYETYNEQKFYREGYVLNDDIKKQLESLMYKEFIESFELFPQLKLSIISYIKQNIKYTKGPIWLINGSTIDKLFLIIKGKVTLYDDKMK